MSGRYAAGPHRGMTGRYASVVLKAWGGFATRVVALESVDVGIWSKFAPIREARAEHLLGVAGHESEFNDGVRWDHSGSPDQALRTQPETAWVRDLVEQFEREGCVAVE